jgi:hypothetical protein
VIIDGQNLEDGKGISRQEFYERLPKMKIPPTTATASSGTYQELYEKIFHQGARNILSIHASSLAWSLKQNGGWVNITTAKLKISVLASCCNCDNKISSSMFLSLVAFSSISSNNIFVSLEVKRFKLNISLQS